MTLLARPEQRTSYDVGGVAPLRPRRRRLAGAAIAVALLALAWGLLPLTVRVGQGVTPQLPPDAGLLVPGWGAEGTGTFGLHYRHHETVTVRVPLRNRGPLPLRIERAGLESGPMPLLVPDGDNLPLTVGPWEEAEVSITLRFDNCRHYHERSLDTWDHLAVEGSVLGRTFDTDARLAYPLALHGQIINHCPDRTLTRGDDARPLP